MPRTDPVMPSSCAFWRLAEREVFYAAAEDHFHCPVGVFVMGFALPDQVKAALNEEVGLMCGTGYFREAEVERLPRAGWPQAPAGIV